MVVGMALLVIAAFTLAAVIVASLVERAVPYARKRWGKRPVGGVLLSIWILTLAVVVAGIYAHNPEAGLAAAVTAVVFTSAVVGFALVFRIRTAEQRRMESHSSGERRAARDALNTIRAARTGGGQLSTSESSSGEVSVADAKSRLSSTKD